EILRERPLCRCDLRPNGNGDGIPSGVLGDNGTTRPVDNGRFCPPRIGQLENQMTHSVGERVDVESFEHTFLDNKRIAPDVRRKTMMTAKARKPNLNTRGKSSRFSKTKTRHA